jgi:carbamoyl-phosphate synthase small subunit
VSKAVLVLEDGTVFEGRSFGAEGEKAGAAIFNTQILGYQEILTDPAYLDQLVVMGYPHIGNYGINDRCFESDSTHASALIIKEYSKIYSNWQANGSLADFMKKNNIIGIEGVDTRAVTIHLRDHGEMKGIVSTQEFEVESLVKKTRAHIASRQKIPNPKSETNPKSKITIINLGINNSTLARFPGASVVSSDIAVEKVLEGNPEQIVISSGPGDPRELKELVGEVKKLVGKVPIYGIQNGACVLAAALGCSIYKMKVGHHGMNIPVVDPATGRGEISAQNHSYGIEKVPPGIEIAHINLNDKTIEKIRTKDGSCVATLYFPIDERAKLPKDYKLV